MKKFYSKYNILVLIIKININEGIQNKIKELDLIKE